MLILAIIAVGLIRSLMSVVAHDEAANVAPLRSEHWSPTSVSPDFVSTAAGDLTVELRSRANDDVRAFLLPAAPEPGDLEQAPTGETAVAEKSR